MIQTRKIVLATIIPLMLIGNSPAWAEEEVDSIRLDVYARLVASACKIILEGGPVIDLASVSKKDVNEVSLGAPVPEGREMINASISQCGQNGQYTLTFSGMPVSNYPNAIASSGEAEGVAHYLKYVDSTGAFYPDGTFLGDGEPSSLHYIDTTKDVKFQLEAGYMRIGDTVTSGKTATTVTVEIKQN
ncbi:TPA: fimbrial protein [Citrobacter braakii]